MTFFQGAEATIESTEWMGRAVVQKKRVPKPYRHPTLDARLRDERTRDEANLLSTARRAGVPVPAVYDVDRQAATITIERIDGQALRDVLPDDSDANAAGRLHALGKIIAHLHDGGMTHGDLTTSNVLVPHPDQTESLVLIDFGLGQFTMEGEQRAVDLHLVEEALEATDARSPALMDEFLSGYSAASPNAEDALRRLEAVRERGRYRGAS